MIPLYNIHAYIYTCSYSIYFFVLAKRGQWTLFSWARLSWEFKSFFDHLLSFCLSVCLSVSVAFHISPEPWDQFQSILIQSILGWSGFKFIQMKETTLLQEKVIQHNSPQNTNKFEISNTTLSISTKHYLNRFGKMKGLSPLQWEIINRLFSVIL